MIRIKGGGEPIARTTLMARMVAGKRNGAISMPREKMPALKDHKPRVTKRAKRSVTKPRKRNIVTTPKRKAPSPPPAQEAKVGRPKTHATAADRQRAYRERQKEAKA